MATNICPEAAKLLALFPDKIKFGHQAQDDTVTEFKTWFSYKFGSWYQGDTLNGAPYGRGVYINLDRVDIQYRDANDWQGPFTWFNFDGTVVEGKYAMFKRVGVWTTTHQDGRVVE
jgi:hypothetical protein